MGDIRRSVFGGKYIFFCPSGLTFCVSPVFTEDTDITALFAGPLLMVDAEEFLLDDLLHPSAVQTTSRDQMRAHFSDLPVVATERVSALSDMIFFLAASLSGGSFFTA